jgi:hypothetical protein
MMLRFRAPSIILIGALACASACSRSPKETPTSPSETRHQDQSKAFSYILPAGWTTAALPQFNHDIVLLPKSDDKNRSIMITDQTGKGSLSQLKDKYERDLPRSLKDFQLISSEVISLGAREVVKIVHLNSAPGVPVRQVNYIVELGSPRYFFACTVMRDDGDKFDGQFDKFIASVQPSQDR